jgi:glycosyltransferase involved in cell wall biosynthesis
MIKSLSDTVPNLDECCLVIPALNPTDVLVDLVKSLLLIGFHNIVVINDGSAQEHVEPFAAVAILGAHLITHDMNLGKGRALKSGFQYCQDKKFRVTITLDADGQHLPSDILAVAATALSQRTPSTVLGVRAFAGDVPLRSRLGNELTQWIFRKLSGVRVGDTQTGLRAFPADMLPRLQQLQGDRYEYEMNVLMSLAEAKCPILEVPIETVYLDGNSGSHFRPLLDSIRIYSILLRDVFLALSSFGLDIALFTIFLALSGSITSATYAARVFSGIYNFVGSKYFVFRHVSAKSLASELAGYIFLALVLMVLSGQLVSFLTTYLGTNPTLCKIAVDLSLYVCSFLLRRYVIFRNHSPKNSASGSNAST